MPTPNRRRFLATSLATGAAAVFGKNLLQSAWADKHEAMKGQDMAYGLVTYMWAAKWDLPTLIANCEKAQVLGVELRTTHAHGVERDLSSPQRQAVKQHFADSPVTLVGLGSNERFDHPEPADLRKAIEATKAFIKLSHDVGGSGVKVKPNSFHEDVPRERTIEQIGEALNVVGAFGADYGQQIRLEVHGQCAPLPIMKQILDVADHPNVGVCWNSNAADLEGEGLEHNFDLVKDRLGATAHVRTFDHPGYPWQQLICLFVEADYRGWIMLEATNPPEDPVAALANQGRVFKKLVADCQPKR
jgi:sugar phosphate isomerase/epimerase